jgi:N-acetylmuramoyl-L-alanine amidase
MKRYIAASLLFLSSLLAMPYTLVIDAGHGGKDPGAMRNGAKEKNINLAVALAFGKLVQQNCKNVKVVYTRKTDVFVGLHERANIANRAKADLFISIHTNATDAKNGPQGTQTYTLGMHNAAANLEVAKRENSVITLESNYKEKYDNFDPNSSESYIIFEFMQDKNMENSVKFAGLIQKQFRNTAKRVDKGVHQAGLLVLRETSMPGVLVELGFINNRSEAAYLTSTSGVNALAKSLYNAFVAYRK